MTVYYRNDMSKVPVPAAGLLLLSDFAALRRRKKA